MPLFIFPSRTVREPRHSTSNITTIQKIELNYMKVNGILNLKKPQTNTGTTGITGHQAVQGERSSNLWLMGKPRKSYSRANSECEDAQTKFGC